MSKILAQPVCPFGVEVELTALPAPDSPEASQLRTLYRQDGLLVVRGLTLSPREQVAFCRIFGPVRETPYENFIVSNVDKDGHLGTRELLWHNDVPYLPSPYLAGCLHALHVDPEAVGTRRLRLAVAAAHRAGPVALVGVPGRTVRPEVQPTHQTPASA